jgi:hypothetical protein
MMIGILWATSTTMVLIIYEMTIHISSKTRQQEYQQGSNRCDEITEQVNEHGDNETLNRW